MLTVCQIIVLHRLSGYQMAYSAVYTKVSTIVVNMLSIRCLPPDNYPKLLETRGNNEECNTLDADTIML